MRLSGVALATVLAVLGGSVAACAHDDAVATTSRTHHANPFANGQVYLAKDPAATAAIAKATGDDKTVLTRFAKVPTAVWLTPESYPVAKVGAKVRSIVAKADAARRTPFFVVYGIPQRDCVTGASAGGLDAAHYATWTRAIAAATDKWTAVVLEPDALASAPGCNLVDQREKLLTAAVKAFAARHTSVYLDAGHANWISPDTMATLLSRSGLSKARGFALNTSFFDPTATERTYGHQLRVRLGTSVHYIVDTSRNGNGSNGQWCNPEGRALGATPHVSGTQGVDAYLWVKPPGESDGYCNGGPAAGTWWTQGALALARNAGW